MWQPPSFVNFAYSHQVCYLRKIFYSLKQFSQYQYQQLYEILVDFIYCDINQNVFFKVISYELTLILVYIDNCMITAILIKLVNRVKNEVKKFVGITDLGKIYWLLSIELKRNYKTSKLIISQQSYIDTSLCFFGLEDTKQVSTLINPIVVHTKRLAHRCTVL